MLPKRARVYSQEFSSIKRTSRVFHGPAMTLRVHYHTPSSQTDGDTVKRRSFAFVVSKKVAAKSVLRSQLRRRGYAAVEHILPRLAIGFSAIIFFKKGIEEYSFREVEQELLDLFQKAGLAG